MQLRCAQIRTRATAHGQCQSRSDAACPHPHCRAKHRGHTAQVPRTWCCCIHPRPHAAGALRPPLSAVS
eukprot:8344304-Prorocentrum_lima.AAC.1